MTVGNHTTATVIVPLHGVPDADEAVCELRLLVDDRLALPVYASVEELVACCGRAQPWMAVPAGRLGDLVAATGADGVVEGLALPDAARHGDGR
ncbi:SAV_915 family protein [Actinomycetospora sp. NBRC 106378]|jgi:hypothetical protein|uniref:SAV_915 family protein n=1 Tax=Actinomycetospora sp. NBRC 106378 TaxID=3032208 RepID=UPI0024A18C15|nr:SAV_915 family protein [Actinomycetospora sp. NBRC 106378]GLZ50630.1 hypothetical protein Acsp07_02470 [Actinomycetospora sp. NBRC 106378]